jgi:hypothetical protein
MDGLQLRRQREFDRIALVSGLGNPQADTACVMSLVARLAGEGHTDRPRCASPLLGAFVIPVNDRMPDDARQRLKPFALRIMGTRDGRDAERLALLRRLLAEQVLPDLLARQRVAARGLPRLGGVARAWASMQRVSVQAQVTRLLEDGAVCLRADRGIALAHAAGQLLALGAGLARDRAEADWHWDTAIGLLDRLCDVGAPDRAGSAAHWPQHAPA